MKELQGKHVYLLPTGNNARRRTENKVVEAKIEKVARVFVTVRFSDWGVRKLRISEYDYKHLEDGHNGGYLVFKDIGAVEDHGLTIKLSDSISAKLRYGSDCRKYGLPVLKKIAELLEIDI